MYSEWCGAVGGPDATMDAAQLVVKSRRARKKKQKVIPFVIDHFEEDERNITHFISIPFNCPAIRARLELFKKEVQTLCPQFEDSLFQDPAKLHLMVGAMNLPKKLEDKAVKVMNFVGRNIIRRIVGNDCQILVSLQGVSFFGENNNPVPSKTRVVYARVASDHLQNIANETVQTFVNHKLMDQSSSNLSIKLHVTLMDTAFRIRDYEQQKLPEGAKRPTMPARFFDSRSIMDLFKDFVFVKDIVVDQIHLSCHHKVCTKDKYFEARMVLKL